MIPFLTSKARSALTAPWTLHIPQTMMSRDNYQALHTVADESLLELYSHLEDPFCSWVNFTTATKDQVMEKIVVEQGAVSRTEDLRERVGAVGCLHRSTQGARNVPLY